MKKKILSALMAMAIMLAFSATAFAEQVRVFDEIHEKNSDDIAFEEIYREATGIYLTQSYRFQQGVLADPAKTAEEFGFELLKPDFRANRTLAEQLDLYDGILEKMRALDYENLSLKNQFDYDFLEEFLETELMQRNISELFYSEFGGVNGSADIMEFGYAFEYGENGCEDDIIFCLGCFENYFDEVKAACEHELRRLENGLMLSADDLDDRIKCLKEYLGEFRENLEWQTLEGDGGLGLVMKNLSDEKRKQYDAEYYRIVMNEIIPALELMIETFETIKNSGKEYRGFAVCEGGEEYYKYRLRRATGVKFDDLGALYDELHETYRRETEDLYDFLGDKEKPALLDEPYKYDFENMTAEELFELWVKIAEKRYNPPVTTECEIVYAPVGSTNAAFFEGGKFGSFSNTITVNNSDTFDYAVENATTIAHEGIPGHMYNDNYLSAQNDPLKTVFDKRGGYWAFSEGWAYSSEFSLYNADDIGANEAQKYFFKAKAKYYDLCFNAGFVVRVHAKGFSANEDYDDEIIEALPDYYNALFYFIMDNPTNRVHDYLGWEAFDKARERAENALGEYFDEKEYNAFLMDLGLCGLDTLEKWEEIWIDKVLETRQAENPKKNPETGSDFSFAVFAVVISAAGIVVLGKRRRER